MDSSDLYREGLVVVCRVHDLNFRCLNLKHFTVTCVGKASNSDNLRCHEFTHMKINHISVNSCDKSFLYSIIGYTVG